MNKRRKCTSVGHAQTVFTGGVAAWAMLILLIGLPWAGRAQSTITNAMSSVVSCQSYDSVGEGTNAPVISQIASYTFYDSLADLGSNSQIASLVMSYQYLDWPTATDVPFLNSLDASYYYQPNTLMLSLISLANGIPQITFSGPAGETYQIQSSTNLVDWKTVTNEAITFANDFGQYSDPEATNYNSRFYRTAQSQP